MRLNDDGTATTYWDDTRAVPRKGDIVDYGATEQFETDKDIFGEWEVMRVLWTCQRNTGGGYQLNDSYSVQLLLRRPPEFPP